MTELRGWHLQALLEAFELAERIKPFQVAKRRVFTRYGIKASPQDILLTALMYKVYRYQGILDKIIAHTLEIPEQALQEMPTKLLYALRLTAYLVGIDETRGREKIVGVIVRELMPRLASEYGWRRARLVARLAERLGKRGWSPKEVGVDPDELRYLLPKHVVQQLRSLVGDELDKLVESMEKQEAYGFRVNTLKTTTEHVLRELRRRGVEAWASTRIPNYVWYRGRIDYDNDPLLVQGLLVPQDEASAAAPPLLQPEPGNTILDLCAAPGGKTTHLAELVKCKARIVAVDVWPDRLERLTLLARRTGTIACIEPLAADSRQLPETLRLEADRVLVDPPCSSTGVLSKHPDARWRLTREKLEELVELQRQLLWAGYKMLKPGGLLLYTVCSILPEEGEENIKWLLEKAKGCVEIVPLQGPYDPSPLLPGTMRAWPHRHGATGFFYALLRKNC